MSEKLKNGLESNPKNSQSKTNESIVNYEVEMYRRIESLKPRHFQIFKKLVEYFSDECNHSDIYGEDQLWEIVGGSKNNDSIEDYLDDLESQNLIGYTPMEGEEDEPDVVYGFYIKNIETLIEILKNFPCKKGI